MARRVNTNATFTGGYSMYQGPPLGGIQVGGAQVGGKGMFGGFFKGLGKASRGGDVEVIKKRVEKFQRKLDEAKAELAEAQGKSGGDSDDDSDSKSEGMVIGRMW